jgi:hypothetical protein
MSTSTKSCRATNTDMPSANLLRAVILSVPIPIGHHHRFRLLPERISTESTCNHVCWRGDVGFSALMQIPAHLRDFTCQYDICLVLYILGTSLVAFLALPQPPTASPTDSKLAQFWCNVSPLECAVPKNRGRGQPGLVPLESRSSLLKIPFSKERRCVLTR